MAYPEYMIGAEAEQRRRAGRLAPAQTIPMPPSAPSGRSFLCYYAALLIFNHFGRPFENFLSGLRIPMVICAGGILLALGTGATKAMFSSQIGKALTALLVWMCLAAPLSVWKGGSVSYVLLYAEFWVVLMLLVAKSCRRLNDIVFLAGVTVFSCCLHMILNGSSVAGRYALSGTYGNSDDVALLAGYAIPFLVLVAGRMKNPIVKYPLLFGGLGYLLSTIGRTGTRTAIPALLIMTFIYFIRLPAMQKALLVIGSIVAVAGMIVALPTSTLERFASITSSFDISATQAMNNRTEADDSALERHELLIDGLKMMVAHPIFGVGPGEFNDYRANHMKNADGSAKRFFPPHNTFLAIGSESGFPGVLLYLFFLGSMYAAIYKARRTNKAMPGPDGELVAEIALCLEANLVYFSICAVFMTCDRHPHQFVLAGMAIALNVILAKQVTSAPTPSPTHLMTTPQVPRYPRPSRIPATVGRRVMPGYR